MMRASLVLGVPLTLLVLVATAFVLGRMLTGKLDRAVERWAIPTSLGLGVLAHLGFILGLAGLLRPVTVLIVLAGIHLLALRVWKETEPFHLRFRYVALGGAALLPLALLTLYPPTAFDATLYHLPFARGFMTSGGLPFLADLRFPVFPQVNEMLFALIMFFAPDVAVHGLQWLMTMLSAALIWSWARDAFHGVAAGWLAAAIFLGNPIVIYLSASGYVEAGLTLFTTSALYAVRRWRGSGERRWLILAAVFAATAADTKYLGLFFVGVIGLTVLFSRSPSERARWRSVLLFGAVAAAVLAPWYGRIYFWTGNPLFPFFPQVFGSSAWAPLRFQSFLTPRASGASTVVSRGIDLVRLPWDVVFERGKYNGQPPYSPLYLIVLPLALVAAWKDSRQRRLLILAAAYVFCCLGLPPDSRYMIPAVPLVSLSAAGMLQTLLGRFPYRKGLLTAGVTAGCAGCFLPGWLYAFYRFHHLGSLPLTLAGREAYLARWQPCYPAIVYLNRTLGSGYTVWAVHAENMNYYARGRFLGDWIGPASFNRVLSDLRGPQDLRTRLRGLGAGYLLIPTSQTALLPLSEDAAFQRWFQPIYADPEARVYKLR
jgi:Dolichyl-phosphate-mannose-protein mannosyltransferase